MHAFLLLAKEPPLSVESPVLRNKTDSFGLAIARVAQLHIQLWRPAASVFSGSIVNIVTLGHVSAMGFSVPPLGILTKMEN